jgi:ABC-type proline/glycine betaine transport system permease subunit
MRFRTIEQGLFPFAITLKTTPIVAIAPLLVLWLGTGWWSKVAAAVLISFFPVLVNTVKGLEVPEADFQDLFRAIRADPAQIFRKLRIPYCLPYFFSARKDIVVAGERPRHRPRPYIRRRAWQPQQATKHAASVNSTMRSANRSAAGRW